MTFVTFSYRFLLSALSAILLLSGFLAFPTSHAGLIGGVQRLSGISWASESAAESVLGAILNGALLRDGHFNIGLRAASPRALLRRELQLLTLTGKNLVMLDGVPVEAVTIASMPNQVMAFTLKNPVQLLHPAQFAVRLKLDEADLNAFYHTPLGAEWLAKMQKGSLMPIQDMQLGFAEGKVKIEGRVTPFGLGVVGIPIQVKARPVVTKTGVLRLDQPSMQVFGIKDSGELARMANRVFTRLVDLSRWEVEHHNIAVKYQDVMAENGLLSVTARLAVDPPEAAFRS